MAPGAAGEAAGEFERIRRYFAPLSGPGGLGLLDDAALVDCRAGHRLVVTADAIVAGVHTCRRIRRTWSPKSCCGSICRTSRRWAPGHCIIC